VSLNVRTRSPEQPKVAPSGSLPVQIAGRSEVGDDVLRGAFGHAAGRGDVTDAGGEGACVGRQHTSMAGEEGPFSGLLVHLYGLP